MDWDANFYLTEDGKELSESVKIYINCIEDDDNGLYQIVDGNHKTSYYDSQRDSDMSDLSLAFPSILFRLQIIDNDDHDQWREYWFNGEKERVEPVIIYKESNLEYQITLDIIRKYTDDKNIEGYIIKCLSKFLKGNLPFNYKKSLLRHDQVGTLINEYIESYKLGYFK